MSNDLKLLYLLELIIKKLDPAKSSEKPAVEAEIAKLLDELGKSAEDLPDLVRAASNIIIANYTSR